MNPTSTPSPRPGARHRSRAVLAGLALAVMTVGAACSGGPAADPGPATDRPAGSSTTVAGTAQRSTERATTDPSSLDPADDTAATEAVVVRSDAGLDLYDGPDGRVTRHLPARTEFGSDLALLALEQAPGWAKVLIPGRPTGATGWVRTDDAELRSVTTEVHIDLQDRTLTLVEDGRQVLATPVAIGSTEAPTPTGTFSLTDKIQSQNPAGAYGPYALGLSGRSEVLTEFAGGDGQIAIHGTNDPSSIGQAVSHGCIRLPNRVIEQLNARLPLGTPVVVN